MSWARIDDSTPDHPKIHQAGPLAELVYYRSICYACKWSSDGFISTFTLEKLVTDLQDLDGGRPVADLTTDLGKILVACRLFEKVERGWLIHDFLDYNLSREKLAEIRTHASKGGKIASSKRSSEVSSVAQAISPAPTPTPTPKSKAKAAAPTASKSSQKREGTSDADWLASLKINPAYQGIDIDRELAKAQTWLSLPKNKARRFTRAFLVGWLNRAEPTITPQPQEKFHGYYDAGH